MGVPSAETPDCAERVADPLAEVRRVVVALESGDYAARGILTGNEAVDVTIRVLNEFARKLEYREVFHAETGRLLKQKATALDAAVQVNERETLRLEQRSQELNRLVRDRTSELVRANQELSRSNQELDQVAHIASHDLQEPLRMVASYAELLSRRYHGQLDDRADKYIRYMTEGAGRMQGLLKDLLDYSRIGRAARPFELTDVNRVLEDTRDNLQITLKESSARLTWESLPTLPADRRLLTQVFQNLIADAIKFRSDEKPHVHVSATRDGGLWTFSVRDNGIGIDAQYAEHIFVIFQRLHPRDRYEGSGVGLAITKKIVDRHRGQIWLESGPEKGIVFRFTIPAESTDSSKT